jgi:hypothetical protein
MPAPQSYKSHTRWDPPFHFFVLPLLLVNIGFAIYMTFANYQNHRHLYPWWIVMAIVLFVVAGNSRGYSLRAQDRIIRLEERLRMAALLAPADLVRSHGLTESQLIGLRFASDAELPALVQRTLDEGLTQKQIKEAIVDWRPYYFRV